MSSPVTYWVGEQPSDPLVVTITDADGNVLNLSDVSSIEFVGDPLPTGEAAIGSALAGKVQYTFEAPFTHAGSLTLQVAMYDSAGGVDYSAPFVISVGDPSEAADLLVTPVEVEVWTGTSVSESDIARAQMMVSLACGRDLGNAEWLATLSASDQYWLQLAVAYQAADLANVSSGLSVGYIPGASSIKNGDVQINFDGTTGGEVAGVSSYANAALKRLSWMQNFRSIQAKPFTTRGPAPDPWVPMSISRGWPY